MSRITHILASVALLAIATPLAAADRYAERAEAKLTKILANRTAGKPVQCLNLRDIQSSQIIDRTAIVYQSGGKLYVNRPDGAQTLDDDDILVTRTIGSQLCRMDPVNLVSRAGRFQHGFVSLGEFVPYARPPKVPQPAQ